jgi:16S rRNA C967 or C1407 C5-methylase (RsmB/RsmF family)
MVRIEAERDYIKDVIEKMKVEYEIPPKIARRLAKTFHKRSYEEEVAANQEFSDAYGALAGSEAIAD